MFDFGHEQTVSVGPGKTFILARMTLGVIREFGRWCAEREGDPFDAVERFVGRVPDAETARMLAAAEETRDSLRYFSLQSPVARRWMKTEEGIAALLLLLVRPKQPAATEDDALSVAKALNERLAAALQAAQGDAGGPKTEGQSAAPATGQGSGGVTSTGG